MADPTNSKPLPGSDASHPALHADATPRPPPLQPDPDGELPEPERIARRVLVVLALGWRAAFERDRPTGRDGEVTAASTWAEARGLVEEMEPEELSLLRAPAGTWIERAILDRGWAVEGAGVLAWALGGPPVPAHDAQVDVALLSEKLGLFTPEPAILEEWVLRTPEELVRMRDRILAVGWRLRAFAARPGPMDFAAFIRRRWPTRPDLEELATAAGDLAIRGVPIALADEAALRDVQSIAVERHRAIEWLCGAHPLWSKVAELARS